MHNLLHDLDEGARVLHIKGEDVRLSNEVLCVGVLGGQCSESRLGFEELAVVTVEGRGQFGVEEDAAAGDGFQGGRAFVRKPQAYEHLGFLGRSKPHFSTQ